MTRFATGLAICCGFLTAGTAHAQSIDEFLAQGYSVMRNTSFNGAFEGCKKDATIVFADGSRFLCGTTRTQFAYSPRVTIMRQGTEAPSVVIVGGRPLNGALLQVGNRHLSVPVGMRDDPLDLANPPAQRPQTGAIKPIEPIQSLNTQQAELSPRLNDAQSMPLAPPKR